MYEISTSFPRAFSQISDDSVTIELSRYGSKPKRGCVLRLASELGTRPSDCNIVDTFDARIIISYHPGEIRVGEKFH